GARGPSEARSRRARARGGGAPRAVSKADRVKRGVLMPPKLIDLRMPVHNDMIVFPRVVRPALVMYETWQEFAERVGAAKNGATSLTASCMSVRGVHVGTHIDSLRHIRETAGGPEAIPIDYCYGDGVVLDF